MDNVKSGGKKSDSEKDVYDNQPNPKIGWKSHPFATKTDSTKSHETEIKGVTRTISN